MRLSIIRITVVILLLDGIILYIRISPKRSYVCNPSLWKVWLDELRHQPNGAFATEDFTFFSKLRSHLSSMPFWTCLVGSCKIPDEVEPDMRKETAYACGTVNISYREFSKEAEALHQDSAKDGNVWKAKLADLKEKLLRRT
jgi:hypothetical protein